MSTRAVGRRAVTKPPLRVSVVRTLDELMEIMAVRSLVYVGEQHCPYHEEFDGNDLAGALHLLARCGREPIGTMRIRWFGEFVKFERICIRPSHRGSDAIRVMMRTAFELAAHKGYKKVLGHIQAKLLPYWQRTIGMRARPGRPSFVFSDLEYIEVERDLEPPPSSITINAPAYVLLRPEGDWDKPGILDRSALRAAGGAAAR